jgi:hypothetical protein
MESHVNFQNQNPGLRPGFLIIRLPWSLALAMTPLTYTSGKYSI